MRPRRQASSACCARARLGDLFWHSALRGGEQSGSNPVWIVKFQMHFGTDGHGKEPPPAPPRPTGPGPGSMLLQYFMSPKEEQESGCLHTLPGLPT